MAYNKFAYIYDRLMTSDVDYAAWCDYLERLFCRHGCMPRSICEFACGTGNLTAQFAKKGYETTALDVSNDMIKVAMTKKQLKKTTLIIGDMTEFETITPYDAIVCILDGMNYIIEPKRLLKTFKNAMKAIDKDGMFVFDLSTRYKLKNVIGNNIFINSEYDVFYSWQNRYIEKYSLSEMLLNFFVKEGDLYSRFEEHHIQRGYSEAEIRILLKKAGFKNVATYDALTFEAPKEDSERIVFACK